MQTEEVTKIKKDIGSMANLRIQRTAAGVEVFMKSEVIEKFMKSNQRTDGRKESSSNDGWSAIQFYMPSQNIAAGLSRDGASLTGMVGNPLMYHSGYGFNFSILRAVGLSEGVKITFTTPTSVERITEWKRALVDYMKWIYSNFMRPVDIDIQITVKEMEG
jgi:hypothetical protein